MRLRLLEPLGVVVEEVGLAEVDVEEARELLAMHGVLVLPEAGHAGDAAFVAFLRRFGPLAFTVGEVPLPGHPELNETRNTGKTTPPRSVFHVDTAYVSDPPAYTALRAVRVPERGGATVFSDQVRAAETLPTALREQVAGLTLTHVATGVADRSSAEHPLLRPHPRTGRVALFLDAPERCAAVSGLDPAESRQLVTALLAHATAPANLYRHHWHLGDVVMWDNGLVMHRAEHEDAVGERVLHRGMVAGYSAMA